MWSRTVTLNIGLPVGQRFYGVVERSGVVPDAVAQGRQVAGRQPRHARRAVRRSARLAGDQRVERRVGEQAAARAPAGRRKLRRSRRAGETVPTWLLRSTSRRGWKNSPSGTLTCRSPYQLSSSTVRLRGERAPAHRASPADVALACTTRSRSPVASAGQREVDAERGGDLRAGRVDVHELTSHPGDAGRAARRRSQPTMPAPTTVTRSPTSGAASQSALTAVSIAPASTARPAGTSSGTGDDGGRRDDEPRLVRVQAEHGAAEERSGGVRARARRRRREVAVLHREREVALLERRPHRGVLARRDAAAQDDALGAAADAGDRVRTTTSSGPGAAGRRPGPHRGPVRRPRTPARPRSRRPPPRPAGALAGGGQNRTGPAYVYPVGRAPRSGGRRSARRRHRRSSHDRNLAPRRRPHRGGGRAVRGAGGRRPAGQRVCGRRAPPGWGPRTS